MKKLTFIIAALVAFALTPMNAGAQVSMDYDFTITGIEFQPGEFIDINVNVYVNENAINQADHGKIFAIEGMAHTANCWKPFAEELFMRTDPELEINEFYAIDMPGRGGSGVPYGGTLLLENMYMEDYLTVIEAALSFMNDEMGVYPNTIMGHSMGGLEVILLQNKLIDDGTNLRKKYKIKNAILLAPAIPAPLDWAFLTNGGATAIQPFAQYISGLGIVLNLPYYVWPYIFFTNSCGVAAPNMVPGAPTPAEVLANGYNSIEAGPLLFQMSGLVPPPPYPYKPRVSADGGIFMPKNGVELTIFAESCDKMMTPDEELELYEYLTNDKHGNGVIVIEGDHTCHDTHIADPHALVSMLNMPYYFKSTGAGDEVEFSTAIKLAPNPAIGNVNIGYTLAEDGHVNISFYDVRGAKVREVQDGYAVSGAYQVTVDLSGMPAGVYFCRMQTQKNTEVKRLVVR